MKLYSNYHTDENIETLLNKSVTDETSLINTEIHSSQLNMLDAYYSYKNSLIKPDKLPSIF